jgi:hypothetical protein
MTYKSLKTLSLGVALLASLSANAQEFDSELQLSTDIVYWYRICSAVPGMESYAMTDLNGEVEGGDHEDVLYQNVFMMPTETEDYRSQWKLTAGENGKVIITNRATGSQISNQSSNNDGDHNKTWLTFSSDAPGFTVTSLGDYAFKLEGVEDDGVNRCLALADISGEAIAYPESGESTSVVGWKFFPVEIDTGIGSMKAGRTVVQVKNKRIYVIGSSEWQLFNAQGEEMPRTTSLATGVYMVKTPQRTIKVMVP